MSRYRLVIAAVCVCALAFTSQAQAEWVVKGKGFGHGVGMSQYGALGYAQQGWNYKRILGHYYRKTKVGKTQGRDVRVLLRSGVGSVPFTGANRACGRKLKSKRHYRFDRSGSAIRLETRSGRRLAGCGREGAAAGGASVAYKGVGRYRGSLVARAASGGGISAINKVDIEGYVKGVVPGEVPASWPAHAVRTQAVAARSYALATRIDGDGYDLYSDTRSQVYGGRSIEHPASNRAVRATAREVVKHRGQIAVAFYSSTSGGRTENVEFGMPGATPQPYLKSVRDRYDSVSPVHRWRVRFSNSAISSRLGDLYAGTLKRIKPLKTGKTPRIVTARVIGSRGSSTVSGATLRDRLGLRSTWMRFDRR